MQYMLISYLCGLYVPDLLSLINGVFIIRSFSLFMLIFTRRKEAVNIIKRYAEAYSAMEKMNVQFMNDRHSSASSKNRHKNFSGDSSADGFSMKKETTGQFYKTGSKVKIKQRNGNFSVGKLALSALFSALSVVILLSGQLFSVFDLTALAAASVILVVAALELGNPWTWLCWGVVSVISLIILPEKIIAIGYALLAGVYPVLKFTFEKMRTAVKIVLKFLSFNLPFIIILFISSMFLPSEDFIAGFIPVIIIGGNALFFIYDLALTSCAAFYIVKLRARLKIWRYL